MSHKTVAACDTNVFNVQAKTNTQKIKVLLQSTASQIATTVA
jgi:hypothetical protein